MDSNTMSQTNNQQNLENSNARETEEEVEVEVEVEDQQVPGFSSKQLCEAVFRTLEIHGKPQALKGRPAETEEKKETSSILAGAQAHVINVLRTYGLEVESASGRAKWIPTASPVSIGQTVYRQNATCKFYCSKCKERGKFTLVALGHFMIEGEGVDAPHLKMSALYFHNAKCENGPGPLAFQQYIVQDFDFQEVFGDTYNHTVAYFQNLQAEGEGQTVGEHINFNYEDYNFDNRSYLILDEKKHGLPFDLTFEDHEKSVIRLFFHMGCSFGLEDEVCCRRFDFPAVEAAASKALLDKKNFRWTDYPEEVEDKGHLFFDEVSLLSGGHNMRQQDIVVNVHQPCHKDGVTSESMYSDNSDLTGKFKPGSFIVPLEDHRTIYIVSPDHTVTAEKGQYMYFYGDVPHGGITYSLTSETCNKWHPALHGHLDSTHHSRVQGNVGYQEGSMSYFPVHHYFIQHDLTPIFDDIMTNTTKVVEVAIDRMRNPEKQPEHKTVPKEYLEQTMIKLCDALTQLKVAIGETGVELDNKVEEALNQLATGSKETKKRRRK